MFRHLAVIGFATMLFVLFISACNSNSPSAPIRICDNLVSEGLIERADCTTDKVYTNFMPHYFKSGETTFDYVSVGMQGFEIISFIRRNQVCPGHVFVEYLTGDTESVSLRFCENVLMDIGYHG